MKIGIASPLSCNYFQDYLYPESAEIASRLSNHDGTSVTSLVLSFLQEGHQIVAFTKDPETKRGYKLMGPNLKVYVVPSIHKGWRRLIIKLLITDLRLIYTMWRRREELDVLSVHWTRDYAFGARFFLSICPVTVTIRDIIPVISKMQHIGWPVRLQNWLAVRERKFHFIANSDYTKEMAYHLWKIDAPVIYNGLSDLFLKYESEEMFSTYTYISISSFINSGKNLCNLLMAYKMTRSLCPNTQLMLVGPCFVAGDKNVMEWKDKGLLEGVILLGGKNRQELKELLTKSHCLVHPSKEESFGNILIEAMACKCLTIGGQESGAVPYVLKYGEIGLLCDVNNPNTIAETMISAYKGDYSDMIEKAYNEVHASYSPDKICQDYLNYFFQLSGN